MTLQGSLDTFGLAEVLQLLARTAKTGCLTVKGDGGRGRLWLRDGSVTAAETTRAPGAPLAEAVCDLLRHPAGTFLFEPGGRVPDSTEAEPVDALLERAHGLLAEWEELQAVVPSLDHRVTLVEALTAGAEVTVSARQWPALVAVGTGCTVHDLAASLGLTELWALRTVNDLVSAGLTAVDQTPPPPPPPPPPGDRRRQLTTLQ
jgi:hypothetical protein